MDALTLTLVAAAILAPLDLVRNSHALERVRTDRRSGTARGHALSSPNG